MSPKSIGRPSKYAAVLWMLDDINLYTPGVIVTFAEQQGFFDPDSDCDLFIEKRRMRIALIRHRARFGFPMLGDGLIRTEGQPFYPAWFGWRWKANLGQTDLIRILRKVPKKKTHRPKQELNHEICRVAHGAG